MRKPSRRYRRQPPAVRGDCRKITFRTYAKATQAAGRLRKRVGVQLDPEAALAYYCHDCGWWHITDHDRGDYDRITASFLPPKRTPAQMIRYIAGDLP